GAGTSNATRDRGNAPGQRTGPGGPGPAAVIGCSAGGHHAEPRDGPHDDAWCDGPDVSGPCRSDGLQPAGNRCVLRPDGAAPGRAGGRFRSVADGRIAGRRSTPRDPAPTGGEATPAGERTV